jgi:hypothetical protein
MTTYHEMAPPARDVADRLFAVADLLADLRSPSLTAPAAIGFARLYAHIVDGVPAEDAEIDATLARDRSLAAACDRLVRNLAPYSAPAAAAAADAGPIDSRRGNGWELRLLEVRNMPEQRWLTITFERPDVEAPKALHAGGQRHPLPEMTDGRIQFRIAAGSPLVRAIADPATEVFLL